MGMRHQHRDGEGRQRMDTQNRDGEGRQRMNRTAGSWERDYTGCSLSPRVMGQSLGVLEADQAAHPGGSL